MTVPWEDQIQANTVVAEGHIDGILASGVRRQASGVRHLPREMSRMTRRRRAKSSLLLLPASFFLLPSALSSFEGFIGSPYAIVDVEMSLDIDAWTR